MKTLPVFAATIAALWLLGAVARMRGLRSHGTLAAYLAAQVAYLALCWISESRDGAGSSLYRTIYALSSLAPIALAAALCAEWSGARGAVMGGAFGIVVSLTLGEQARPELWLHLALAATVTMMGIWALFGVVGAKSPEDTNITLLLGLFWLLNGAYLYGLVASTVNMNLSWVPTRTFAPVTVIVIFSWLAWKLSGGAQMEAGIESAAIASAAAAVKFLACKGR
jgi:hypothetical protein